MPSSISICRTHTVSSGSFLAYQRVQTLHHFFSSFPNSQPKTHFQSFCSTKCCQQHFSKDGHGVTMFALPLPSHLQHFYPSLIPGFVMFGGAAVADPMDLLGGSQGILGQSRSSCQELPRVPWDLPLLHSQASQAQILTCLKTKASSNQWGEILLEGVSSRQMGTGSSWSGRGPDKERFPHLTAAACL